MSLSIQNEEKTIEYRFCVSFPAKEWYKLSGTERRDKENDPINVLALTLCGNKPPSENSNYTHTLNWILINEGIDLNQPVKERYDCQDRIMRVEQTRMITRAEFDRWESLK